MPRARARAMPGDRSPASGGGAGAEDLLELRSRKHDWRGKKRMSSSGLDAPVLWPAQDDVRRSHSTEHSLNTNCGQSSLELGPACVAG